MDEVRRLLDAVPAAQPAFAALRAPAPEPAPAAHASPATPGSPPAPTGPSVPPALAAPVGWAAGLLAVAGIIHLVLLPGHLESARGVGLYFCAVGGAQVVWALLLVLRPTRRLAWLGAMALAVQPLAVYALTRVLRQPFGDHAEPVDLIGAVTGLLELASLAPFAAYLSRTRPAGQPTGRAVGAPLAAALAAGLLLGAALYGLGLAAEELVPWLDEPESPHGHGHPEATAAAPAPAPAAAPPAHQHGG